MKKFFDLADTSGAALFVLIFIAMAVGFGFFYLAEFAIKRFEKRLELKIESRKSGP